MSSIVFLGTYEPMVCGIGDYTSFIANRMPVDQWKVISFDPENSGMPLSTHTSLSTDQIWYGIPDRDNYSSKIIQDGLRSFNGSANDDAVLWFQHENGIWHNDKKFASTISKLGLPKIITFHTLHFQSHETSSGLRESQYKLLKSLLPYVDGVTVFSRGVFAAVTSAFPEYRDKIYGLKHGIHSYPNISRLSTKEAREWLWDFILHETDIDTTTKASLFNRRIFQDPNTVIIGQAGFLDPAKQSELLFRVREDLQRMFPGANLVAMRIGSSREHAQMEYAERLRLQHNYRDQFLLEVLLPQEMLALAQKAFNVNMYWPKECTQSGALSHALGAGAIIAGRDVEGVGEMLRDAGQIIDADLDRLTLKIRELLLNPDLADEIREHSLSYANNYTWQKQALRHCELADRILATKHQHREAHLLIENTISNIALKQSNTTISEGVNNRAFPLAG